MRKLISIISDIFFRKSKSGKFAFGKVNDDIELIPVKDFLGIFKAYGIILEKKYTPPALIFKTKKSDWEYWDFESGSGLSRTETIKKIFSAIGPADKYYIWQRGNCWKVYENDIPAFENYMISEGLVPLNFNDGAVVINGSFLNKIIPILTEHIQRSYCVEDDISIIPEHGKAIVDFSHHDSVTVSCRDTESVERIITQVEKE